MTYADQLYRKQLEQQARDQSRRNAEAFAAAIEPQFSDITQILPPGDDHQPTPGEEAFINMFEGK